MSVDPSTAAAYRDTPAGPAYFCSAACAAAFDADPGRYARPASAVPGSGAPYPGSSPAGRCSGQPARGAATGL